MNKELKIQIPEGYEIDKDKSTFENIVLKPIENKYPTSVKDIYRPYTITTNGTIVKFIPVVDEKSTNNDLSSYQRAEAFLALMQLVELRDAYNKIDSFVPDWTDSKQFKYNITYRSGCMYLGKRIAIQSTLFFGNVKTRNLFYNNFKDLIEQAKELL